jgi:hypothetical protein
LQSAGSRGRVRNNDARDARGCDGECAEPDGHDRHASLAEGVKKRRRRQKAPQASFCQINNRANEKKPGAEAPGFEMRTFDEGKEVR